MRRNRDVGIYVEAGTRSGQPCESQIMGIGAAQHLLFVLSGHGFWRLLAWVC